MTSRLAALLARRKPAVEGVGAGSNANRVVANDRGTSRRAVCRGFAGRPLKGTASGADSAWVRPLAPTATAPPKQARGVGSEEARREAARVAVLARYRILDPPPGRVFDDLAKLAARAAGAPMAAVSLVDERRQWFEARVGTELCGTDREVAFCARAIERPGDVLVVEDAACDPRFATSPLVAGPPHLRFYAGVPIRAATGEALGTLCVLDVVPRRLGPDALDSLVALARQVESQFELRLSLASLTGAFAEARSSAASAREAERRCALAFDKTPVAMNLVSPTGRFLQVNAAFCRLAGRAEADLVGRPVHDVVATSDRRQEGRLLERLTAGELPSIAREGLVARSDGADVPVLATTSAVRGAEGDVAFFLTQIEDLTTQREADRALGLMRDAVEAIVASDANGDVAFWNPGAEAMFGYSAREAMGRPVALVAPGCFEDAHRDGPARPAAGGDGRSVGGTVEVSARRRDGTEFPAELSLARAGGAAGGAGHVAIVRDVTERKRLRAELERRANVDALTGLASKARFADVLGEAAAEGRGAVVMHVDLDRFRVVNDSLGHAAGDAVLRAVAGRLAAAVPGAVLGRLGGDEFGVLCRDVTDAGEARGLAERLLAAIGAPFDVDERTLTLGASVGIGSLGPGTSAADALRDADLAMYRAKGTGRGRVATFDEGLRRLAVARLDTEVGLREALAQDRLRLLYQPEFDLRTGRITAVEALLRWDHPTRGLLTPGSFIGVAEDSGLIGAIGEWALGAALRQVARWRDAGVGGGLAVAVNVSALQVVPQLVDVVAEALDRSGVPPDRLCLEVTESAFVSDPDRASAVLGAVAALGASLSVDDFGTGYSSLAYLKRFSPAQIKIDRAFVEDVPHDDTIVRAVVGMAAGLGARTVAEGVETPQQLERLRRLGCDLAQGYLLARPLAPAALEELLAAGARRRRAPKD